jgi:hypothetical protein
MISRRELFRRAGLLTGAAGRRTPLVLGAAAVAELAAIKEAQADQNYTTFAYNATGGSTPRTSPARWADRLNVKDFGATGDGTTDDTTAIQSCLNAAFGTAASPHAGTTSLNKAVYFPAGNYRISSALRVTQVYSGMIYGDGMYVTGLTWLGGTFNGNSFVANPGNSSTPNTNVTCMLECDGFARSTIKDMFFSFGNSQDKFTACLYAYGGKSGCHAVWVENVSFGGGTFGVLLGAVSPLVSEWHFNQAEFGNNGTAGIAIYGQNTLNHTFIESSFSENGLYPITSSFTGAITGTNLLTVTAFDASANKMPLSVGLRVYSDDGAVSGGVFITALGTGTGGTGTYSVTPGANVSSRTIKAMYPNRASILNVSGSIPTIHGCDFDSDSPLAIYDSSSNAFSVQGVRAESIAFIESVGTPCSLGACYSSRGQVTWTGTSTGPVLHITALSGGFNVFPGMVVSANDGTNSLPTSGSGVEPATRIIKQLTGAPGGTGDYLMTNQASPGNLTSTTITGDCPYLFLVGSGMASLDACGSAGGIIIGSNNAVVRIRNNQFTRSSDITPNLLDLFFGQVLEYDIAADNGFTVANLPTPRACLKGVRMFVTESTVAASGNFAAIVAGGGANAVPVFCDGTNWRIG